ncbi:MAG TPA: hypothetical protein PLA90_17380, partial [Candidatus Sumerlaeota bacterium]|nr:hypothetical protein [Candidatus Sumerlaeota bacterium]
MAWGLNTWDQCSVSGPNQNYLSIAAGGNHSLGLKSDGSVIGWGDNESGQCDVPSPNSDFVAIAAGYWHSLGLKSNGSIVAWGSNENGNIHNILDVPLPNRDFVSIAAREFFSLGLKSDGSVVAWGDNEKGQCNVPAPNSGFIEIAAGYLHCLGLKSDGSIVAWGLNTSGQCNVPAPNAGFVAVAGGEDYSLGLKADGTIVAWGSNTYGQCNIPVPNRNFVAIAGGSGHALALVLEGDLQVTLTPSEAIAAGARWRLTDETKDVWHDNTVYDPVSKSSSTLLRTRIGSHTLTFKDLYGWTKPADRTVELNTTETVQVAGEYVRINWPLSTTCTSGTVQVTPAGSSFPHGTTVTLTVQPDAGTWFNHWTGDVPAGWERVSPLPLTMDATKTLTAHLSSGPPPPTPVLTSFKINNGAATAVNPTVVLANICTDETSRSVAQYLASESSDFVGASWKPYGTVSMFRLSRGAGVKTVYYKVKNSVGAESTVTSDTITLAGDDFSVVAWGYNGNRQCDVPSPNRNFIGIAGGEGRSVGLKADGSVVMWGEVGGNLPSPNSGFVSAVVGEHYAFLKSDGSTVGGSNGRSPSPNRDIVAIASGHDFNLGLRSDGSIIRWGYGPILPSPNRDFVAVAAGWHHGLGLKTDGSVVQWGNISGEVPSPNKDFVAIAGGYPHSLGLKSDGSIVEWGGNKTGGSTVPSPNRDFVAVAAGQSFSAGLKSDGSIVVWGSGANTKYIVPQPNSGYVALAAGDTHLLALVATGDLQVSLTPPEAIA